MFNIKDFTEYESNICCVLKNVGSAINSNYIVFISIFYFFYKVYMPITSSSYKFSNP